MIRALNVAIILVGVSLVSLGESQAQGRRAEPNGLFPVIVRAVDGESGKPVTRFDGYWTTRSLDDFGNRWNYGKLNVVSPSGTVQLDAPRHCRIQLGINSPDHYLADKEHRRLFCPADDFVEFTLLPDDPQRQIVLRLRPCVTVQGVVRNARTGQPIAGAVVTPWDKRPDESATLDPGRAVRSDSLGRYEVREVRPNLGIRVVHPEYIVADLPVSEPKNTAKPVTLDVSLESGPSLAGIVVDPAGKPLAGVAVADSAGRIALTDQEGAFVLKSPQSYEKGPDRFCYVELSKTGFIEQTLHQPVQAAEPLRVVLNPLLELTGQVLSADGRPVPRFKVMAGPNRNPMEYESSFAEVRDDEGRFSLWFTEYAMDDLQPSDAGWADWAIAWLGKQFGIGECTDTSLIWVGVRAEGYAAWEGWINIRRTRTDIQRTGRARVPVTVQLQPGVTVTGKLHVAQAAGQIAETKGQELRAVLVPQRNSANETSTDGTPARDFATLETQVAIDGTFRFIAVRPDNYTMEVYGPGITPRQLLVVVAASDLDLGVVEIEGEGTGRIVGQAHKPKTWGGGPWAFAMGRVESPSWQQSIEFQADENGRFSIETVPAGMCSVWFNHWRSNDICDAFIREVQVVSGRTSEVRLFDPSGDWNVVLDLVVGDGSKKQFLNGAGMAGRRIGNVTDRDPMFLATLVSLPGQPVSFPRADWHTIEGPRHARIVIPDVHPGRYHLVIGDFQGSIGSEIVDYRLENVEVQRSNPPIRVSLGAGAVTGPGSIAVVGETLPLVRSWGDLDNEGNSCVRYLPVGKYTVYSYNFCEWNRHEGVDIRSNRVTHLGRKGWTLGGIIFGKIALNTERRLPSRIVATDSQGITVEAISVSRCSEGEWELMGHNGEKYFIPGLWPDEWTVTLLSGTDVLATRKIRITGAKAVLCDLVGR